MLRSRLWLALGAVVAMAFASGPARAGDFGVRFSYRSGPRCSSYYHSAAYAYCDPAAVVQYTTCAPVVRRAPVVVVRDRMPRVVVYRDYAPRRYYATRKVHPYRVVKRAVRRLYPGWNSYSRSYWRHGHWRHHRYFSGGRHYRGGSFDIGFRHRR